ncbi:MAG: malto-oligosyltrehalose trehalohydrolase [Candidatus Dormibacteraeota bacterium]|nr:malto-oligosyltrehalose trehalohydrolase [Candidatus Dormibacteraeota bacterium]
MGRFAVWAPATTTVDVDSRGGRHRLSRASRGWHEGTDPSARPGDDYAFSLDGGLPLPDPRSQRQPRGVHGPSQLVDHAAFAWTDGEWRGRRLRDCVLYEMHCGTFSEAGTFDGAVDHIPDLVDLGVDAVEVMPVAAFPGARGWGYDGVDLFAVHEAYGGPDGLKRFVDACHASGIAVVMDVVYNHLGPDGNVLGAYGPYFTATHRTPWGDAVNYDSAGSDEVRRFVVDNALMWLRDYHCDGLRIDAVHAIVDTSAVHVVEEIADSVHRLAVELGRELWVIAESDLNDPRVVRDPGHGGYGCDAQWSDDFHHALHSALTGERDGYYTGFGRVSDVAAALRQVFVNPGGYSAFRDRRHGRSVGRLTADHFLGYLQNHDQVGNRARGERSAALMSTGKLRIGAALVLLGPFVPMLFAGEEWAASTPFQYFTDHQRPDLADAVSEGRRREFAAFGWEPLDVPDPQDPATFARSRLRWDERRAEPHRSVLDWHRCLTALRRDTLARRDGDLSSLSVEADDADETLVMTYAGLTVACNWGQRALDLVVPAGMVVAMADGAELDGTVVHMQTDSVAVLRAPGVTYRAS